MFGRINPAPTRGEIKGNAVRRRSNDTPVVASETRKQHSCQYNDKSVVAPKGQ